MSWMKNFITKVKPILKQMPYSSRNVSGKKKKKKGTSYMTSIGKDEETARSLLTTHIPS